MGEQLSNLKEYWTRILGKIIADTFKPATLIAYAFYGTYLYLVCKGMEVPAQLNTAVSTLFGFWFGNKVARAGNGK